jgi:peptidoglycan L-alanyl-D-glutamate endopeptidase CwlK
VLEAYRDEQSQNMAYASGRSKLQYPASKHNRIPSEAIDISPYPYDPTNTSKFYYFAGYVMALAKNMGIKVRWGGDFNQNLDPKDDKFKDLFHFELAGS